MAGMGKPGEALPENGGGFINIEYADDVWIEARNQDGVAEQKKEDEKFIFLPVREGGRDRKRISMVASKYLKKCYEILTSPENLNKSAAVLLRRNYFEGMSLREFEGALRGLISNDYSRTKDETAVQVRTVHKYKGLERDLIIILDINVSFPLLHPDNNLFRIFGRIQEDEFMEEKRLFYVAVTRVRQSLYIVTEREHESVFISRINQAGLKSRRVEISDPLPF